MGRPALALPCPPVKAIRRRTLCSALITAFAPSALAATNSPPSTGSAWIIGQMTILCLGFAGWVALALWLRRRILSHLQDVAVEKSKAIASRRLRRVSMRRVFQLFRIGTRLLIAALILGGAVVWATLMLECLPATRETASAFEHSLFLRLEILLVQGAGVLPDLALVVLIFFATRITHEFLNHYFLSVTTGEVQSAVFDEVTAETTRRLANIGIWVAAIIIAFPYLPGSGSAAFRGVTVLAGLMISLGSANLVAQFTSGLTLIYGRAVRPGDYLETPDGEGTVERMGLFACTLRTSRDELLVLPHSALAKGLKNLSRAAQGVRCATAVTIGYDTPWRRVRELLLAAAAGTPGIRAAPPPEVRQAALEDFAARYELLFTPENPADRIAILGRLHAAIQDQFHAAGVQIMSPHYNSDPATAKVPPGAPPA
jgi:small-conductance mechanosensitive channel